MATIKVTVRGTNRNSVGLLEPVWKFGEGVIQALDVDARAERPDGQYHPQDEALSV